jgi:hypothetical protein
VADMPFIDELVATKLRSADRDRARQADLFVQDAVRPRPDLRALSPSIAQPAGCSRQCPGADYFTRHQAIDALSGTGPRSNTRHLESNFAWYLEHDALYLEDRSG